MLTPKRLAQAALAGVAASVYTAPAGGALLRQVTLCNASDSATTVSLHVVPSGGTAGAGNAVLSQVPLAARQTFDWTATHHLAANDQLVAVGAGVTLTASGAEY
jgi:hypothetical protein